MKNFGQVVSPYDAATKEYVDGRSGVVSVNAETGDVTMTAEKTKSAPEWKADITYSAGAWCVHNGELWHNTSGASSTGVEPGTDYNVWNVTYSNENLLDNPFFTLNQRGQTRYDGYGSYTLDRWRSAGYTSGYFLYTPGTHEVEIHGVSSSGRQGIHQYLPDFLPSGIYTFSAIVKGHGRISAYNGDTTVKYINFSNLADYEIVGAAINTAENLINGVRLLANAADVASFLCCKLERGSVSTLYNDLPPDYGAEFVKCVTSTADSADTYANKQLRVSGGVSYKTIVLTGTGDADACYITINGTKYTSAQSVTVPVGTDIVCTVKGYNASYPGTITLNGRRMVRAESTEQASYTLAVTETISAVSISFTTGEHEESKTTYYYGTIDIVTT